MIVPRIFVSFSCVDKTSHNHQFVVQLVNDLRAAGADVVVDDADDPDDFAQSLNHALPSCDWVVLVETPEELRSPRVQLVVNTALSLVDQQRMQGVLRVIAEPCDPQEVSPSWRTCRVFDACQDYARALTRLLLTLGLAGQEPTEQYKVQTGDASSSVPHVNLPPSSLEDRPVPLSDFASRRNTIPPESIIDRPAPLPALPSRRRLGRTALFSVTAAFVLMIASIVIVYASGNLVQPTPMAPTSTRKAQSTNTATHFVKPSATAKPTSRSIAKHKPHISVTPQPNSPVTVAPPPRSDSSVTVTVPPFNCPSGDQIASSMGVPAGSVQNINEGTACAYRGSTGSPMTNVFCSLQWGAASIEMYPLNRPPDIIIQECNGQSLGSQQIKAFVYRIEKSYPAPPSRYAADACNIYYKEKANQPTLVIQGPSGC